MEISIKAKELVDKFLDIKCNDTRPRDISYSQAKQCALIVVDEIIKFGNQMNIREPMMYWNKVKQEIKKL